MTKIKISKESLNAFKHNKNVKEESYLITTSLKIGSNVYWNDPEGVTSGEYTVIGIPEPLEEDSIILITNGYGESEVTLNELIPII